MLNSVAAMVFLAVCLAWITWPPPSLAWASGNGASSEQSTSDYWVYPVTTHELLRDFLAPNSDYSAGHRGLDFAAAEGEPVFAVADGVVRFAGQVGGRGVVSLDLADGYVAEVEPVCASVATGDEVLSGQQVGTICGAGSTHCHDALNNELSCVHLSARKFSADYSRGFAYVSPLLFLGAFRQSHLVAIGTLN